MAEKEERRGEEMVRWKRVVVCRHAAIDVRWGVMRPEFEIRTSTTELEK